MAVGGYTIIDLKGADIQAGTAGHPEYYAEIERNAGRKPILIKNFRIGEVEQIPAFTWAVSDGIGAGISAYILPFGITASKIIAIMVQDDGAVRIRNIAITGG